MPPLTQQPALDACEEQLHGQRLRRTRGQGLGSSLFPSVFLSPMAALIGKTEVVLLQ